MPVKTNIDSIATGLGADRPLKFAPRQRSGRWVQLVPVLPSHLEFLYKLATDDQIGPRWRFGGAVPSIESFQHGLSNGLLVQFVVEAKSQQRPLGHVVAYGADLNSGIAYLGGVMDSEAVGTGFAIEALEIFLDYLFATFSLRKIYLEVPEFNVPQFARGYGELLREEGRLRGHVRYDGEYWDRVIIALYRDEFLMNERIKRRRAARDRI